MPPLFSVRHACVIEKAAAWPPQSKNMEDCNMRRLSIIALSLFLATTAFAADDVVRRGFNVAPGGTLRLDADIGSIKIVTGGTGVAVEVVREAWGRNGDDVLKEHQIKFQQNGNDVVITSDFEDRWDRWFRKYSVQWNIRVPSRYNLDIQTSGGSIELADIGGTVQARTSGGSIATGRLAGDSELKSSGGSISVGGGDAHIKAHTSGGSITIGNTSGPVEARTSGGSIKLAHIAGEVVARTSGGGIRIDDAMGTVDASTSGGSIHASMSRQPKSDSRLSTSGGGVTLEIAPNIAVDLDAHASGGGVHADVPVTVLGTQDDNSVRGKINGGGPKLVLRTSGGGIRVRASS